MNACVQPQFVILDGSYLRRAILDMMRDLKIRVTPLDGGVANPSVFAVQTAEIRVPNVNILCIGRKGMAAREIKPADWTTDARDVVFVNYFSDEELRFGGPNNLLSRRVAISNGLMQMSRACGRILRAQPSKHVGRRSSLRRTGT